MFVIYMAAILYAVGRFAPAAAVSVRDDKVATFEGWKMTSKVGERMCLSYLSVMLIGYFVILTIQLAMAFLAFGDGELLKTLAGEADPALAFAAIEDRLRSPTVKLALSLGGMILAFFMFLWYLAMWGIGNYAVVKDVPESEDAT